jgi:hypothetical protein
MQANSTANLRRWEREKVAFPVSLVLKPGQLKSDNSTTTINISLSGLAVRTALALVPRQELAIVFKEQFSRTISACVVWVREDKSSSRTIAGLKFLLYKDVIATYKLGVPLSVGVGDLPGGIHNANSPVSKFRATILGVV